MWVLLHLFIILSPTLSGVPWQYKCIGFKNKLLRIYLVGALYLIRHMHFLSNFILLLVLCIKYNLRSVCGITFYVTSGLLFMFQNLFCWFKIFDVVVLVNLINT